MSLRLGGFVVSGNGKRQQQRLEAADVYGLKLGWDPRLSFEQQGFRVRTLGLENQQAADVHALLFGWLVL